MEVTEELTTNQWKRIIDRCRQIGIPQLTFTGGEPTRRDDLVELIRYAAWFVTRLNTNGTTMTPELAEALFDASLDAVQLTLYSSNPPIHDSLVGCQGAWELTVRGIKNAIAAGLNVSVNTPLVRANADYAATLRFLCEIGVRFVSCSGLIPTGGAPALTQKGEALTNAELMKTMMQAVGIARELGMELAFTSPGSLNKEQLRALGLPYPYCGACLSNMAVAPNGAVVPCQSWLGDPRGLGNILTDPWSKIWNHPLCRKMRSAPQEGCPLEVKS